MTAGLPEAVLGAESGLRLQRCADCGRWAYPPRAVCAGCLSDRLEWQAHSGTGTLIAGVRAHITLDETYNTAAGWPLASIRLDSGQTVLATAHGLGDAQAGTRVIVGAGRDPAGRVCLYACTPDTAAAAASGPSAVSPGKR